MQNQGSAPEIIPAGEQQQVRGNWTTAWLKHWLQLQPVLVTQDPAQLIIQADAMDSNGALTFLHLFGNNPAYWPAGLTPSQQQLLQLVLKHRESHIPEPVMLNWVADIGYRVSRLGLYTRQFLEFLGQLVMALLSLLRHPHRFRLRLFLDVIQKDGLHAVPIVALLSFLLGAVVAWQGALQLKAYGANIFIVELVALTHLRELGPLITAILVAGRSGSAYAAQLATMNMNQEIQALRSLGQNPFDWLILPKLLGLLVVLPLLTLLADLSGLVGGMLVAQAQLDISPSLFWQRLGDEISIIHFVVGMIKAPVFALIIVNVGCMQGMLARGGAEAVGLRTTRSVVQAIFLVIITDALFSILFSNAGW
ncbi:MlaE family ABC transporter permease [Marinospirillum alkaliphilum]|uniref:Phospholipid/cholesterol/gamma-HCH transport system permease protein n=1 Tax=Marinospirillum alkaliphilum DSM 21637 TaxID=1122209 RepID=A0A1K1WXT1_9GAMM|nr:ABC transporter permease [Marinospirillum alkaliphilum]SFX42200.1 phospholipid/cholesterol/gamma-HCH transport system permease protein [Marinospirillum alkaliphilum DSM 21637]